MRSFTDRLEEWQLFAAAVEYVVAAGREWT